MAISMEEISGFANLDRKSTEKQTKAFERLSFEAQVEVLEALGLIARERYVQLDQALHIEEPDLMAKSDTAVAKAAAEKTAKKASVDVVETQTQEQVTPETPLEELGGAALLAYDFSGKLNEIEALVGGSSVEPSPLAQAS